MLKSLQVCGTSGSGKTTLVRRLYEESDAKPIMWFDNKKKEAVTYETVKPIISEGYDPLLGTLYFLGSYKATCGGCDTIPSVSIVAKMLQDLDDNTDDGIVIFEGLMISHMIGTVGQKQKDLGQEAHWRAYLDTELHQCLENVISRRQAAGNLKPFNPSNTQKDWPRVKQSAHNWIQQGGHSVPIRYHSAWEDFNKILETLSYVR